MEAPLLLPVSTASSSVDIDDITATDGVSSSPPAAPSSPSTQSIVLRFVAVIAVVCASLFAQHEAAKGFGINVVSAAGPTSTRGSAAAAAAGRRFDLFFVSNGRAERILHYASRGVERALFPDASFPRKQVRRVTVRMAGHNLTAGDGATVDATAAPGEFVISLSPALLVSRRADDHATATAVAAAVRRAVARMWLWDGRGAAPKRVTEAMVEYLASVAAGEAAAATPLSSVDDGEEHRCMSARFLRHLERQREGFVARLNRAMRDRWSDAAMDAALGAPASHACAAYRAATSLTGHDGPTTRSTTTLAASTSDASSLAT